MIHQLYKALQELVGIFDDPAFQDEAFKKGLAFKALRESGEMQRARITLQEMDDLEERMVGINPIQRLQFELMKHASFNQFDGERVVDDLIRYKDLWTGAVMGPFSSVDLIPLRDIGRYEKGYWNVDQVMILSSGKDEDRLELLAKTWKADDVKWLDEDELKKSGMASARILSVWWD